MLPKLKRMKGEEVDLLFSRAKTLKNPLFITKYMKNEGEKPVFAVAASKKVFKTAVLRNKTRRRIYSAIRAAKLDTIPYSFVIIPNREVVEASYKGLVDAIINICEILKKSHSK